MTDPIKLYPAKPTKVYFYGTCLVDLFYPDAGMAGIRLLEREGIEVIFPQDQTCCGQPAFSSGFNDQARDVIIPQLDLFPGDYPVVVPAGSCGGMMRKHYPELFAGTPWQEKAEALAARTWELTDFLLNVCHIRLEDVGEPVRVAMHTSCSARREMGVGEVGPKLLGQLGRVELVEQARAAECCGFGGTFAVRHPEISEAMVADKTAALVDAGAETVVATDCGCMMNITGYAEKNRHSLRGQHIVSFLWERTTPLAEGGAGMTQTRLAPVTGHFHPRVKSALDNPQIRSNFRNAMDGLMSKRRTAFEGWDLDALRDLGAAVRLRALATLPELLETLESNCLKNGIQVHWAQTGDQACEIIRDICKARNARSVIKGKSMVSEEMELNHFLEADGIETLESDLGEYIVQLAEETPSHIIMPAIHKNTDEISELMHDKTGTRRSRDVAYLTASARQQLREKFMRADVGVSGVNFAVAETGTLCLVENEGNGRLTTTVPSCHIAVTGIEKVVEQLKDVTPLLSLLTRSATGQHITTYVNMISGPRKAGEKDGPEEVHLVLVDSGRSSIYQDQELLDTLRCIRCGACMNHCPVYTRVGGHAYGTTYPGPIGKILMPHLLGLEQTRDLPSASTLCGACGEVCPVRIPIPKLLQRLRKESVDGDSLKPSVVRGHGVKRTWTELLAWNGFRWWFRHPGRYRLLGRMVTRFRNLTPSGVGSWSRCRTAPKPAKKTLHQLMQERQNGGAL